MVKASAIFLRSGNSTFVPSGWFIASVPGLPRYAIYCARLIVRGRETLKTGKAWDETSRAHRRWVDAGSRAPRCLDHNYKRIHSRAFDARKTAIRLAFSFVLWNSLYAFSMFLCQVVGLCMHGH